MFTVTEVHVNMDDGTETTEKVDWSDQELRSQLMGIESNYPNVSSVVITMVRTEWIGRVRR
jgi:hypothetical protein